MRSKKAAEAIANSASDAEMQEIVNEVAESIYRDAMRYRWLRDQWDRIGVLDGIMLSKSSDGTSWVGSQVLDKRIDAAIQNAPDKSRTESVE